MQGFLSTLSLRRATSSFSAFASAPVFLSTLSLRRATPRGCFCYLDNIISIHALLAESDYLDAWQSHYVCDFYPRSPCGERQSIWKPSALPLIFLSTLSLRRATHRLQRADPRRRISIHALLAESDRIIGIGVDYGQQFLSTLSLRRATRSGSCACALDHYFYPRSPCGERHGSVGQLDLGPEFLSTLSLRRATTA